METLSARVASLLAQHLRRPWNILLFLSSISLTSALLQNRTIDNHFGDDYDKAVPTYSPSSRFYEGSIDCDQSVMICRLAKLIDRSRANHITWEGASYDGVDQVTVSFHFTGTAIYVYCIVPNIIQNGISTFIHLNFRVDGQDMGSYIHNPASTNTVLYDVPVYANTMLPNKPHTFDILLGSNPDVSMESVILFDYAVYSFDPELPIVTAPDTTVNAPRTSLTSDTTASHTESSASSSHTSTTASSVTITQSSLSSKNTSITETTAPNTSAIGHVATSLSDVTTTASGMRTSIVPSLTMSQIISETPVVSLTTHHSPVPLPLIICVALAGQVLLVTLIIIIWRRYQRRLVQQRQASCGNGPSVETVAALTTHIDTPDRSVPSSNPSRTTLTSPANSMLDIDSIIVIGREDAVTQPAYTETMSMTIVPSTPGLEVYKGHGNRSKEPILL